MISKIYRQGVRDYLWFYCPGCKTHHRVPVTGEHAWTWNGSEEKPTLSPSINITWHKTKNEGTERVVDAEGKDVMHVCHSFVVNGRIQFLGDCTHELVGTTVDLPELP